MIVSHKKHCLYDYLISWLTMLPEGFELDLALH